MATLRSLISRVSGTIVGNADVEISGVQYDSRVVKAGDIFACLAGQKVHGHAFIPQVVAAGAAALIVEDPAVVPEGVTALVVPDSREAVALVAAAFYGYPGESLTLIGVTGTNGKTTTVTLLRHILQAAGHPTGLIGTMAYHIGDEVLKAPHTTPQAPELQAILAHMRAAGLTHAVMEVSSHALCLHRVTGCRFALAGFTNLTQDHLDYHGTMEAYRDAKVELFANPLYQPDGTPMISAINADDPNAEYFAARALGPVRRYGTSGGDYHATDISMRADGSTFVLNHPAGSLPVSIQLVGSFNISNALAALALAIEAGVDPALAAASLAEIPPVDGRCQRIPGFPNAPAVIVDYAHTPDGLEKILKTADEIAPGRVITLFGCGGDRDRTKRPKMAAIAAQYARDIIVTSDNPRSEDPGAIIEEILTGFPTGARVQVEADRAEAIRMAIHQARADDIVVLAGKGHEDYQIFADRTIHFDDREEARKALAEWAGGA